MDTILETKKLTRLFGKVVAASDISVQIAAGQQVGIIGANGAGKTTFVNLITGYTQPDSGTVHFLGEDITGAKPRAIVRRGIARSFQVAQLFDTLTVRENILIALAAQQGMGSHLWQPLKQTNRHQQTAQLLEQFDLLDAADRPVSELSEGGLKLLDVALSLALEPRLLIMDEPTSGVSSDDKFDLMDMLVQTIQAREITLLFIEHDLDVVRRYAERVLVFENGEIIASGKPDDVLSDAALQNGEQAS